MTQIYVTQKDIDEGIKDDPQSCPISLACYRRFKSEKVNVYQTTIEIDDQTIILPARAIEFIAFFDKKLFVKPFRFSIKQ